MSEYGETRENRFRYITKRPYEFPADSEQYQMDKKNRTAVIFNHYSFVEYLKCKDRPGTEKDVERLKDVLNKLHFSVEVHEDFEEAQIKKTIRELQKKDFSDQDCLAIFVLTHGHQNSLAAKDYKYQTDILWKSFTGDACPTLAGKPKLIFISACRGSEHDYGVEICERLVTDGPEELGEMMYKIPCHADILLAFSTFDGYTSLRDPNYGTYFIQFLCDNLSDEVYKNKEIMQILTRTKRQVSNIISKKQTTQVPTVVSTLLRDLYLG